MKRLNQPSIDGAWSAPLRVRPAAWGANGRLRRLDRHLPRFSPLFEGMIYIKAPDGLSYKNTHFGFFALDHTAQISDHLHPNMLSTLHRNNDAPGPIWTIVKKMLPSMPRSAPRFSS
jgi:hypothetical protein